MENKPVIIAGAGLAGSLMAIYLAKKGVKVLIVESRADMRLEKVSAGRSINLALSDRGIFALNEVGIDTSVLASSVKMYGRMLHAVSNELKFAPYGKDNSQFINSISRAGLNKMLMTEAEKFQHVEILFETKCESVDFEKNLLLTSGKEGEHAFEFSMLIGADGANSMIRKSILDNEKNSFEKVDWLEHGYKELTIPAGKSGAFLIEKNALHIWPRGNYMLIALPNADGSFTCTLFFPIKGELSFESLNSVEKINEFFEKTFPDAKDLITNLTEEFKNNPVGKLGTLKCYPWISSKNVCLIGDAAHAIVPFYGQGMNASFEDCRILNNCIEKNGIGNWSDIISEYQQLRKENGDAIGDLAIENFYEMRDHVANPVFRRKRELEHKLENMYSDYHSKYSLVTFQPEMSYSFAKKVGNMQDDFLMSLCENENALQNLNLDDVYKKLKSFSYG